MADINRFNRWSTKKLVVHYQRISRLINGPFGGPSDIIRDMARSEE